MEKQGMSFKGKAITAGAIALATAALYAALFRQNYPQSSTNQEKPRGGQSPTQLVSDYNYPFTATIYQSNIDSNDVIVKFNNEFYKAIQVRDANSGEGVLAELDMNLWKKYGVNLCTSVLENLCNSEFLQPNDKLYNLVPIQEVGNDLLTTQYKIKAKYGVNHTLLGEPKNLTDVVNQK